MDKKGFTLIEIMVVLAVTALLSTISIVYSHVGQNQISLSVESSKVAQLILEAKQLSVATYSRNNGTCAYGVDFDYATGRYSLFAYNSRAANNFCPSLASTTATNGIERDKIQQYQPGSWQLPLASGVKFINPSTPASDTIYDVLFFPPDPFTLISLDGKTFLDAYTTPIPAPSPSNIYLKTADGSAARTITVNSAGQVSL